MTPTLSVVVVSHNTRDLAVECIASVEECAADIDHEIFLVDNASSDGTPEAVANAFPDVHVIARPTNAGFSVGTNEGIRRARGRYTLLLNPDARVLPGALQALVEFLDTDPSTGLVGCRLVNGEGRTDASAGGLPELRVQVASWLGLKRLVPLAALRPALRLGPLRRLLHLVAGGYLVPTTAGARPHEVEFLSGACVLVRRAVWEQVGLLDERIFMFLEDADICRRAAEAGWRLHYMPGATVVHLGGSSFAARSEGRTHHQSRERVDSLLYYFRKHRGPAARLALRALLVVAVTPRLAAAALRSDSERRARLAWIVGAAVRPG